jgi:hypothetical protein
MLANASVSLDGYIAYEDHSIGDLFKWYANGDVRISLPMPATSFAWATRRRESRETA